MVDGTARHLKQRQWTDQDRAVLDHGSRFADIEGRRSSLHENRAGDVSGGEVAFTIEGRRGVEKWLRFAG